MPRVPTETFEAFEVALGDVENLIAHHPKSATGGRGRPASDEGPLNRSCILLLYAGWEVFAEGGVRWAVRQLCERVDDPSRLPERLRGFVATSSGIDPWALAASGWRMATVRAVDDHVIGAEDGSTFGINTAGPKQLDGLHKKILGVFLIGRCAWRNKPNAKVKADLNELVDLRGEIAHTGRVAPGRLSLQVVRERRDFLRRLAETLDAEVEQWVDRHLTDGHEASTTR